MNLLRLDENVKIRKQYVNCPLWKRCVLRFVRGFIGSFAASLATMVSISPGQWTSAMILSAVMGALSGGFLALDKYLRETT